ncbi:hypothetical protein [Rhodococcus sp. NPDC057529]|uniref:hypothetical protein n=1 Tax=Rhodococcus sp. NPDC057529 TaxID=3346158 RepID=UPI00366C3154
MVADLVDEVGLVQLRRPVQVESLDAIVEFGAGPVLVGRRFPPDMPTALRPRLATALEMWAAFSLD